jgi:CMP-N-acetylneuraminic acid synthetase
MNGKKMLHKKKVIAIISARGGSKRIKNKNLIKFGKIDLIGNCIKNAKKSKFIDKIVVNTDSKKIKNAAENNGIAVPFLRNKYADDKSQVDKATWYALNQAEKFFGKFDIVVQLIPNCPFVTGKLIDKALLNFKSKNFNSQISYAKFIYSKPEWAVKIDIKKNKIHHMNKIKFDYRSQDLEDSYYPTGVVWVSSAKYLKRYKTFRSPGFGPFICDYKSSIDIDTLDELKVARVFLSK